MSATVLAARRPSSLTSADVGIHVSVTHVGSGAAVSGVLLGVRHCASVPDPHTHLILSVRGGLAHAEVDDVDALVLVDQTPLDQAPPGGGVLPGALHVPPAPVPAPAPGRVARVGAWCRGVAVSTTTGRVLAVLLAVALMVTGVQTAFTSPPLTLVQPAGALLFGVGGALLIRLWHVADSTRGRS